MLNAWIGVPGIFGLTGILGLAALAVVRFRCPIRSAASHDRDIASGQLARGIADTQLLRLNYGTFALHAVLMALFTQIPFALRDNGLAGERHWIVYLPVLLVSLLLMLPFLPGRSTAPDAASCCSTRPSRRCSSHRSRWRSPSTRCSHWRSR